MKQNIIINKGSSATKSKNFFAFAYVLIVLICFYPYEFYSVYLRFLPDKSYLTALGFFIFTAILLFISKARMKSINALTTIMGVQLLGFFMVGFVHNDILTAIGNAIMMGLAALLIVFIDSKGGLVDFIKKYNTWIVIMAIAGTVTWVLVTFRGFEPFYVIPDRADTRPIANYLLTFTKSVDDTIGSIRYAGFFDEPGAMAYWGIFALIINKLFVKIQRLEIILIVCLLFTFSIGFYAQLLVYFILFYLKKRNIGTTLVVLLGVGIFAFAVIQTEGTQYDAVYNRTYGRVLNILEGRDVANNTLGVENREEMTELAKKEFLNNPLFGTSRKDIYITDNIYEPLALYGIFGSLFVLSPFIFLFMWSLKNGDHNFLKANIVIWVGFAHRPFHNYVLYFFILYLIIVMYKQSRSRFAKELGYQ